MLPQAARGSQAAARALEAGSPPRVKPVREPKRRAARRREREGAEQPVAAPVQPVASVAVQRTRREAPITTAARAPRTVEPERLRPSESRAWRRSEPSAEPPPYEFETLRVREEPMQAWDEPVQGWADEPDQEYEDGTTVDLDMYDEHADEIEGGAESYEEQDDDGEVADLAPTEPEPVESTEQAVEAAVPAEEPAPVENERPAELEPPGVVGFAGGPIGFAAGGGRPAASGVEAADGWEIEDIQGIGPAYARRLRNAGVSTIEQLLEAGATQKGRKALAVETGIRRSLVMRLVSHADLLRVEGVDPMLAELLEAVGVTSPSELARRNVTNLVNALVDANRRRKIAPSTPTEHELAEIVANAHTLERIVRR